jgi:hypothetical protein
MPSFTELEATIICPYCGATFDPPAGIVRFQWGKVTHYYRVGDQIRWLKDRRGHVVPPFVIVKRRLFGWLLGDRYNRGEPQYENVFVLDTDPNFTQYQCEVCSEKFDALGVEIRGGRIISAVAFRVGELSSKFGIAPDTADIIIVNADGSYWPRYDWIDAPLKFES